MLVLSAPPDAKEPPTPVIVELFSSEGCSSCPPADAALLALVAKQPVAGARIIPLAFHVDYWDRLGWRDPFSDARWTGRQDAYARGGDMYTPQMIVDGEDRFVGGYDRALQSVAARTAPKTELPLAVQLVGDELVVTTGAVGDVPVWVAITERGLATDVRRGENSGRRLEHPAVVRRLEAGGRALRIAIDPSWKRDHLGVVAFAQRPGPGAIVAVTTWP